MDFDPQGWLWALPLVFAFGFACGWLASRWDVRQWRRDQRDTPRGYYKGLNFLLNEQHDKAIDAFIEAVQQDPDTSELHFALGNLFRRRGEYERAVRVHEHLLQRADLPRSERDRAQHELAQDFLKAGLFDRAEAAFEALSGTPFHTESRLALLALHERSRNWRAAVEVAQQLERSGTGSFATRIAHYWCELVVEADAGQHADAGEQALAHALAAAPHAARPLVVAGERAVARGDHAEAYRVWNQLMQLQPAAFNLVARRYAAAADTLGRASSARERLQGLYEQLPSMDLLAAIASLSGEAGGPLVLAHLREHPTLAAAQAVLEPRVVAGAEEPLDAVSTRAVRDAVRSAARPLHRYRCAACGFEAEHYFWQCPGCLGWDTYPPQRLEDT